MGEDKEEGTRFPFCSLKRPQQTWRKVLSRTECVSSQQLHPLFAVHANTSLCPPVPPIKKKRLEASASSRSLRRLRARSSKHFDPVQKSKSLGLSILWKLQHERAAQQQQKTAKKCTKAGQKHWCLPHSCQLQHLSHFPLFCFCYQKSNS